jgi:S1-C subfamily serine protease
MTGYLRHSLITAVRTMTFLTSCICQQRVAKASAHVRAGREVVSRMPVDMLTPLSGSLQQLASEVSPAVVQIEVSGYGPADQGDRKDAAMIVRLHAIGSGVIVDPEGYIMNQCPRGVRSTEDSCRRVSCVAYFR